VKLTKRAWLLLGVMITVCNVVITLCAAYYGSRLVIVDALLVACGVAFTVAIGMSDE